MTTDLTTAEIAKKFSTDHYALVKGMGRQYIRTLLKDIYGIKFPKVTAQIIQSDFFDFYRKKIDGLNASVKSKVVSIDGVNPSSVFDQYRLSKGFFATQSEGKKDQFPDAFIFESLKPLTRFGEIIIVSKDKDFVKPCSQNDGFKHVKSFTELFAHIGVTPEEDIQPVDDFLQNKKNGFDEHLLEELHDWGIEIGDVMDAEVTDLSIQESEIQDLVVYGAANPSSLMLVTGSVAVKLVVDFTHPDWDSAMWDSDDKRLIPFDTVVGDAEAELTVPFSISISVDKDLKPKDIEKLGLTETHGIYIDIQTDYFE